MSVLCAGAGRGKTGPGKLCPDALYTQCLAGGKEAGIALVLLARAADLGAIEHGGAAVSARGKNPCGFRGSAVRFGVCGRERCHYGHHCDRVTCRGRLFSLNYFHAFGTDLFTKRFSRIWVRSFHQRIPTHLARFFRGTNQKRHLIKCSPTCERSNASITRHTGFVTQKNRSKSQGHHNFHVP